MRTASIGLGFAGAVALSAQAFSAGWSEERIGDRYVLKQQLRQFKGAEFAMVGYDCVTGVSRFMFATNVPVGGRAEVHQHYEQQTYPRAGAIISMDGTTFVVFAGKNAEWLKAPFLEPPRFNGMPYGFDISLTAGGPAQVVQGEGFAEKFRRFVKGCPEKLLASTPPTNARSAVSDARSVDDRSARRPPQEPVKTFDPASCAQWGQIQVNGVARKKTFADALGRPEQAIILEMETPICFQRSADGYDPATPPQKLAHLIGSAAFKIPLGKKLSITGYAGHSETAHHHASVIIDNFKVGPYEEFLGKDLD